MNTSDFKPLANFIWSVADLLRGPYRPPQYERVIRGFQSRSRIHEDTRNKNNHGRMKKGTLFMSALTFKIAPKITNS